MNAAALFMERTAPLYLLSEVSDLNYFEKELRKIVEPIIPDATYVGRACFIRLGNETKVKLQFVTGRIAEQYEALRMTVLNPREGEVDNTRLRFSELFECKGKSRTFCPSITDYGSGPGWYLYTPTAKDYAALRTAISDYLSVFQDMEPEKNPSMGQQMM